MTMGPSASWAETRSPERTSTPRPTHPNPQRKLQRLASPRTAWDAALGEPVQQTFAIPELTAEQDEVVAAEESSDLEGELAESDGTAVVEPVEEEEESAEDTELAGGDAEDDEEYEYEEVEIEVDEDGEEIADEDADEEDDEEYEYEEVEIEVDEDGEEIADEDADEEEDDEEYEYEEVEIEVDEDGEEIADEDADEEEDDEEYEYEEVEIEVDEDGEEIADEEGDEYEEAETEPEVVELVTAEEDDEDFGDEQEGMDEALLEIPRNDSRQGTLFASAGSDPELVDEAVELVQSAGRASVTFLQRRLRVGYDEARELLEVLRQRGIVDGEEGALQGHVQGGLD